ncbi:hypothetical protein BDZ91DRAFT_709282 [Kalaharituber pfeilii]|nr:hypothetical protein BDZ91DRAFT_709282 [Kalaharituber pfeilii]
MQTSVTTHQFTKGMLKYGETRHGGNAFGVSSDTSYYWYIITTSWTYPQHDDVMNTWSDETIEVMHEALGKEGLAHPFVYLNDVNRYQDVFATYGQGQLARLKRVRD